jgi:hypothetical protein
LTILNLLGYMTTSQIQRYHNLGSVRNAQRILKDLSPYLCQVKLSENAHYLSKRGREWVEKPKTWVYTTHIEHHLLRSEMFVKENPLNWISEYKVDEELIADALYKRKNGQRVYLEIDRTQKMKNNAEKIEKYAEHKADYKKQEFPLVVFVTETEYRFNKLRGLLADHRLKSEVYMTKDLL